MDVYNLGQRVVLDFSKIGERGGGVGLLIIVNNNGFEFPIFLGGGVGGIGVNGYVCER